MVNKNINSFDDSSFMCELARELSTQDNLGTANPLYCVQVQRQIYGESLYQPDGSGWGPDDDSQSEYDTIDELLEYLQSDEYCDCDELKAEVAEALSEFDKEYDHEFLEWHRYEFQNYWEFQSAHLTMQAAQDYITHHAHNLGVHRIYVTSQYGCHEFNRVVEIIKDLEE